MAASDGELLASLFNHIVLPPRLPGRQDTRLDRIEHALIERLLRATIKLSRLPDNEFVDELESLRRSLETCRRVNSDGRLNKSSLLTALRELHGRDFIALHILEQNAALIIRLQENGKAVLFEAFEASPLSEDVLGCKNALRWDFPGSAVAIPTVEYANSCFQNELATFLEKASTESIKKFAAHTNKAGSLAFESRDTVDPALITQMLMTLLEVNGCREFPPILRKRVRDDVCWSEGGENPWRRCPFWLVLRVAVHRHLSTTLGGDIGRIQYKFLICLTLSRFLDECIGQIDLDLVAFLKTKLCRRLVKLELDRDRAPIKLSMHYKHWFTTLGRDFRKSTTTATERISLAWEGFKKHIRRPILTLPRYANPRHLVLSLPSSREYIRSVLYEPFNQTPTASPIPLYKLPQDYQRSSPAPKPGTVFANQYFRLSEMEIEIENRNELRDSFFDMSGPACEKHCIELAGEIENYLRNTEGAYDNNPEQKSTMLITVMELWVLMDKFATVLFPLLKDYNPGIPSDILDVLQIARLKDMRRLHMIREYLRARHLDCKGSRMTIFVDPGKGCFGERYYSDSRDSRLQDLHQLIETAAEKAREAKEREWQEKTLEFEKLVQKVTEASCLFTTDEFLVKFHDDRNCTKCYLNRKARRFRLDAYEHPLPTDPIFARTVIFEISCPKAFAAYRDRSWQIISTLAFPTNETSAFEPRVLLGDYSELRPYVNSKSPKFTLASTTKSFLRTHYACPRFPVGIEDICLPNGLKLGYFDTQMRIWPARLPQARKITFAHHCQLTLPANSPLSSLNLNFSSDLSMDSRSLSSYEIVASQSKCPSGLNVHEYISFQTLLSGKSRRWPQILIELGSSNLNFSTEATTALITMLALEIGPRDENDPLGAVHGIFRDKAFCTRLMDQLDQRLDGISSNWRETNCMETLITVADRVLELGDSVSAHAVKFFEKARVITSNWISALRSEIQTATDEKTSRSCSRYALWAALLCRRTFALHCGEPRLEPIALRSFIECSISLQDNMVTNPAKLPCALKNALTRDLKMVFQMRSILRYSLEDSPESLISSISTIWPNAEEAKPRKFSRLEFLPDPDQWWTQVTIDATSQTVQQTVHFHLLEGHLLVMGKPIGKLPSEWSTEVVLQQLFGNQSLLTYPSSLPGMTYMLAIIMNGHQVHLGSRRGKMFVRARVRDAVLELIPPQVFGTQHQFDLPASLVDKCVHWLDLRAGVIEIRQSPDIWKSKKSNWLLDFNTGHVTRRNSNLVDPHSPLFHRIAGTFEHFEYRRHLTAFQPRRGRLTVELRRLELTFFVNRNNLFESPQLRSEVDPDQDAGTWYGLNSKLVLREVVNVSDPVTGYSSSVAQRQRTILVPMGDIKHVRRGQHISLFVENIGDYAKFMINDVLGRLDCPAEPRLLYLKAMYHAYTSFVLPDPLTGRTGTEEALHCLKSGYCQPWAPITAGPYEKLQLIARLTPRREYYPKSMKVMQITIWNPQLTTVIQHDGYWAIVDAILEKSKALSVFSLQKIQLPPLESVGETHLTLRSRLRRESYQRQNSDSSGLQSAEDEQYATRDRWRVSQERANVAECTKLLRAWPSALPTTRDLAGILQKWPTIGGYNGRFEKALLTDLLDVQWATDWGSLVNLFRESTDEDAYRLMFLFAIMSFRYDAVIDVLRTLIAFCVLQDLKAITPPKWPGYTTHFRLNQVPRADYLLQLMKTSLIPYGGDVRSSLGFSLNPRQRRKLESAELAHEEQQESDAKVLAEFLLQQWPCPEPTIEGLGSEPLLVDLEKALELIRPEWLRLFQNKEHSDYVSQVQRVLDCHYTNPCQEKSPALGFVEQDILQCHPRDKLPTLQSLLSKAIIVNPRNLTSSKTPKKVDQVVLKVTSNLNLETSKTQKLALALSPEIRELKGIIGMVTSSESVVRRQYGEDLFQSLNSLVQFRNASQEQQNNPVNAARLAADISQAQSDIRQQFGCLQKLLEQEESSYWLQQGGLWPLITPVTLLENLRSTSSYKFGNGIKNTLLTYAQSITGLQRLLRMEDALQKKNVQRLMEEQENTGHSNWKPLEYPDWLLLEIDSNILIRSTQVDVALATIYRDSGSNSVLQMNMGQGKTACIIPMAAAVLADSINLVRVVVPKPLLLQTAQLLHARLGGLLGRELRHIPFSRKTPTTSATIKAFHSIHRDIQKSSGILIALPEHLLSFMLCGLQQLSDTRVPEAASMIKVQNWLNRRARDVIDECDSILALRTQLIYPSGSQNTVDGSPHRWEIAEAVLGLVDGHLHNLHKGYPHSIEVLRREQGGFPVVFFLRKDVEDELISRLVNEICSGRTSILPEFSRSDRLCIKKFISEATVSSQVSHWISKEFTKPAFKQAVFLLRGLFVHRILLMTLKKRWNVQYGLHPTRDPIAVPYHAKGTPSDQAEWGHPDVAILFTCLAFYYDGLYIKHLREALEHVLKSDDPSQVYDRFTQNSSIPDSLKEWNSINVDDEGQIQEIWRHVRYNVIAIDYFLNNFVFPKHAKQFKVKLQASGWDIPLLSAVNTPVDGDRKPRLSVASTTGFSGTNDWKGMLPLTISQHDLPRLSHTNAEVLTYLLQNRNRKYVLATDSRGRHISEHELLQKISREGIRVLIDAGAQILEMDNLSLVKAWLEIAHEAPAAVYLDNDNKPQVLYRKGYQVPLVASPYADDLSECLVYLDEAHTRGTDLKMPTDARGALTLGLGQTKDHTVQAAMRLRQLGTTQSITFFAPPEVHQSILDLCNKKSGDPLCSYDVICWLLEQTCSGIEQLQPLYFSQGADFCRRVQAALDCPDFIADSKQRETYLASLRQIEQQTLRQLYGHNTKAKLPTPGEPSPRISDFMRELNTRRKGFQDVGNAVHGSALQEVEQEREVAFEVEAVREVQKPIHCSALAFPGLHKNIVSFARTGRLAADPAAYELAFSAMGRTNIGKKYDITTDGTSGKLYVSVEFMRTVMVPSGRVHDQFQRQVNWILWSTVSETALIIIPEEAEHLLPLVIESASPVTHVLTYAAPVTRKMLHFNDLQFYAIPRLVSTWEAPLWLRTELGISSGRLYFEHSEYKSLLGYLSPRKETGKAEEDEIDGVALQADGIVEELETSTIDIHIEQRDKCFTQNPLSFLQEWLAIRRKGQDFAQTPMGFICQGKKLLQSHPFFAPNNRDQVRKEVRIKKTGATSGAAEEGEVEGEFYDDDIYSDDFGEDLDNFDDAELLNTEEDEGSDHGV